MKREAKTILREELKAKGLNSKQIEDVFESFNNTVQDKIDEKDKPKKEAEVRHGTTCIGIINPQKNKTVTEW